MNNAPFYIEVHRNIADAPIANWVPLKEFP
jgi:hypothetical protein